MTAGVLYASDPCRCESNVSAYPLYRPTTYSRGAAAGGAGVSNVPVEAVVFVACGRRLLCRLISFLPLWVWSTLPPLLPSCCGS